MSRREQLFKKIEAMTDEQVEDLQRFVDNLHKNELSDYSTEQMQTAYDNLHKLIRKIDPPIDNDAAKRRYFEERYGRID